MLPLTPTDHPEPDFPAQYWITRGCLPDTSTLYAGNRPGIRLPDGGSYERGQTQNPPVGEYVIEGHVPAADIVRLLREKPPVKGVTAPGMPMGSPGMEGPRKDPYEVLTFQADGETTVYARHNQ